VHFREVGSLGGPVVHLVIDVGFVVALPRHIETVAPNALGVRGKWVVGAAGGDEQIAPVLIEQRGEGGIRLFVIGLEALVGRPRSIERRLKNLAWSAMWACLSRCGL
jgi:hypothetical protein